LKSGWETGVVLFLETAQHVLFAQQCGLHPSRLGTFEKMQEAAGSWSGRANIATTTVIRMAVFRIADIYHNRLAASMLISDVEIGDYSDTQQIAVS
jgi:hypothetical protein